MSPTFLFGKIPAHGDFVWRGLAAGERARLDDWLSRDMADARVRLGEQFDSLFDRAPPSRFLWSEGDGLWTGGALAPSADGVGRRFPLVVARRRIPPGQAESAASVCEQAIYDGLASGWSADRLSEAAAGAAVGQDTDESPPSSPKEGWWVAAADGSAALRLGGATPSGLLYRLLTAPEQVQ